MSRKGFGGDPIEALRGADPLDPKEVPKDASGPHARALFQEVTSVDTQTNQQTTETRPNRARRLVLATSGAAAGVVLAVLGLALFGENSGSPDISGGEPIVGAAMCVEFYDLETLANREIAFDGTLVSSAGDAVTFEVHDWFSDGSGDTATLAAIGLTPGTVSSSGTVLELDERYLVSGSGGNVWACGFTMTYDSDIAADWAALFSS